jgi:RNA polymerase sigma-70 factor (ECF subfamily)
MGGNHCLLAYHPSFLFYLAAKPIIVLGSKLVAKCSVHTDDKALIEACLRHDRMAQEFLYQRYFEDAFRTCNRYLSQYADVMEVVNAGFLKVFQHLRRYDPGQGSPGAWIHRIMVNTAIDHIRKEGRVTAEPLPEQETPALFVHNEAAADMDAADVLVLVKILPPATRVVFNMSVMEGYSHKEIAQTLNMSESTSRWHLTEAKKRLQQLLREKEKIVSA